MSRQRKIFSMLAATLILGLTAPALIAQPCEKVLTPSVFDGSHRFGESLDISGDVAVATDRFEGVGGAVYVYRFDGVDWIEEQILTPAIPVPDEEFGWSVAIDGDVIAVGSRFSSDTGGCTVFRHDGTSWLLEQSLAPPSGQVGGEFGRSVAVSADRLVIGASETMVGGFNRGIAYVYQFGSGQWQLEQAIEPPIDWTGEFGFSVDVEMSTDLTSGTIVVGEPLGGIVGFSTGGAVSVFEWAGGSWTLADRVHPPAFSFDLRFGGSVSISGDTFIVGAYRDDEGSTNLGAASIYRRGPSGWSLEQKLIHSGSGDQVGRRVAISGDTAILSVRNFFSGRSIVYSRVRGTWSHDQDLINEQSQRFFGQEVAIDGNRVVLGSRNISSGPVNRIARVYTRTAGEWDMFGFFEHPENVSACLGDPLELSALATSPAPLTYQWQRDGVDLPGETATTLTIASLTESDRGAYTVVIESDCGTLTSNAAEIECREFLRGDSNGDGMVEAIGDSIRILMGLFGGFSQPLPCLPAADVDGSSSVNIADAIYLLNYGFSGGPPPALPFPECGSDPSPSFLPCDEAACE